MFPMPGPSLMSVTSELSTQLHTSSKPACTTSSTMQKDNVLHVINFLRGPLTIRTLRRDPCSTAQHSRFQSHACMHGLTHSCFLPSCSPGSVPSLLRSSCISASARPAHAQGE
jgi:hypothetical protein